MNPKIKVNIGRGLPPVEVQQVIDTDLDTSSKSVVGAINELKEAIEALDVSSGSAEAEVSVFNADTHYDFPSVGSVNVIYKAQSENQLYQWDPDNLKYVSLCDSTVDVSGIEVIHGGDANPDD